MAPINPDMGDIEKQNPGTQAGAVGATSVAVYQIFSRSSIPPDWAPVKPDTGLAARRPLALAGQARLRRQRREWRPAGSGGGIEFAAIEAPGAVRHLAQRAVFGVAQGDVVGVAVFDALQGGRVRLWLLTTCR